MRRYSLILAWATCSVSFLVVAIAPGVLSADPPPDIDPGGTPVLVTTFGANPDDLLDDTNAMQAAADYACANPGTKLIYPPAQVSGGAYRIDRLVDWTAVANCDLRDNAIHYTGCDDVSVVGYGARIEVRGDFVKGILALYLPGELPLPAVCRDPTDPSLLVQCAQGAEADTYQSIAFAIEHSQNFGIYGFEIDGNVDAMEVSDATTFFAERSEYGILFGDETHDITLYNLNVHHFATDGIIFAGLASNNVEIRHVTSANHSRMGLSIAGGVRNLLVQDTQFLDAGIVSAAPSPTTYTTHSPARGVDVEPECLPDDADWALDPGQLVAGCQIAGNILFERVTATGSLGGQIAFPHGEATANVTVRDSFLQNPIDGYGDLANMGIAGGVIETSTLDAQLGYLNLCTTVGVAEQRTSPVFLSDLAELAADPWLAAHGMIGETQRFSSILRDNVEISGRGTLVLCNDALPYVEVSGNTFTAIEPTDVSAEAFYPYFGLLSIWHGEACTPGGNDWAEEIVVEANTFTIPAGLPLRAYGVAHYCGPLIAPEHNVYGPPGANPLDPFTVNYEGVTTVRGDCFPGDGSIRPVDGALQPLTLSLNNCLTLSPSAVPTSSRLGLSMLAALLGLAAALAFHTRAGNGVARRL